MEIHPLGAFDNSAKDYSDISVKPLAAAMGAEIHGVQISDLTDAQFSEIEDALYCHKMIFFRDQNMTLGDQESFTLRFGEFGIDAYTSGVKGYDNVQPVIKEADAKVQFLFGSGWHTDSPFLETPPAISMLYGVDIPPYGGDTIWCNSALAYRCLSDTMKHVISDLRVHMSAVSVIRQLQQIEKISPGAAASAFKQTKQDDNKQKMIDGWFHPMVRTHPKSGEKSLYIDHTYSTGIQGMTEPEAQGLLAFLQQHVTQPAFSCRLRWQPRTLTLWDNRGCIHQAFNDYDGFRREMYRTTVNGEVPR